MYAIVKCLNVNKSTVAQSRFLVFSRITDFAQTFRKRSTSTNSIETGLWLLFTTTFSKCTHSPRAPRKLWIPAVRFVIDTYGIIFSKEIIIINVCYFLSFVSFKISPEKIQNDFRTEHRKKKKKCRIIIIIIVNHHDEILFPFVRR